MDINIRRATPADIPWLATQLESFDQFFAWERPIFDSAYVLECFLPKLVDEHVVLLAERGDERLGFIAGLRSPHLFNPAIMTLMELFWWVPEEHRGTRAGLMLLNAFTEHGAATADWVSMSLEHNSPVREETLTRRGYRMKERAYLLEAS